MQFLARRLYATTVLPEAAGAARTGSTPRAVRLRRLRKQPAIAQGDSDMTAKGLTPSEYTTYRRLRANGGLVRPDGGNKTEEEWLEDLNTRRARVRGVKRDNLRKDGGYDYKVVGQKVYLPNIIFRLVRNNTPMGQPYNPYEATFRIPQSVTKTDVRSYLTAVYGVKTTYIRTDNYLSPVRRDHVDSSWSRTNPNRTYKRAVVGLMDPFYYPMELENMDEKERKEREGWIEEKFAIGEHKRRLKYEMLRMTKNSSGKDWKWWGSVASKRSAILRNIAERRALRENLVSAEAKDMQASRAKAR